MAIAAYDWLVDDGLDGKSPVMVAVGAYEWLVDQASVDFEKKSRAMLAVAAGD